MSDDNLIENLARALYENDQAGVGKVTPDDMTPWHKRPSLGWHRTNYMREAARALDALHRIGHRVLSPVAAVELMNRETQRIKEAVAAEREACAALADKLGAECSVLIHDVCRNVAAAIRRRGETVCE